MKDWKEAKQKQNKTKHKKREKDKDRGKVLQANRIDSGKCLDFLQKIKKNG